LAEKIGAGPWRAASAQGGQLNLTLPAGVNSYAIAYYCPGTPAQVSFNEEFVFEATVQDNITKVGGCPPTGTNFTLGSVSGSVDASAILGVAQIAIYAPLGAGFLSGSSGSFNFQAEQGSHDVAFTALDASNNIVGIKIVPLQPVPGTVNNGNPVIFSGNDATTSEPLSVTNVPTGSGAIGVGADYFTANGTIFSLGSISLANQYSVVPPSEVQTGDRYEFFGEFSADLTGLPQYSVMSGLTLMSAAPVSLALPNPLPYAAPPPAAFPNIPVTYSGSQVPTTYIASLHWLSPGISNGISVSTTPAYQATATGLSVPDLSGVPGFIAPAGTGTIVNWSAGVVGETPPPPAGTGSIWFATNYGTYTEP
jgi:hypothetical protein